MVIFSFLNHLRARRLLTLILSAALIIIALIVAGGSLAGASTTVRDDLDARPRWQDSPVPLQLPTFTPTQGPPTETPTRTPTSEGRAMIEAITDGTNVRGDADIGAPIVGKIFPGFRYPIIGQLFKWFYIEYPDSPSGTAWVYEDVVTVTGDQNLIEQWDPSTRPDVNPEIYAAQETADAITQTPGLAFTLTAQSQITPTGLLATGAADDQGVRGEDGRLPTYTFPPYTITPIPVPQTAPVAVTQDGGVPPLIPILVLGSLGLVGLLVSILRRV